MFTDSNLLENLHADRGDLQAQVGKLSQLIEGLENQVSRTAEMSQELEQHYEKMRVLSTRLAGIEAKIKTLSDHEPTRLSPVIVLTLIIGLGLLVYVLIASN